MQIVKISRMQMRRCDPRKKAVHYTKIQRFYCRYTDNIENKNFFKMAQKWHL